ncbi:MAG TPA: tetratricopeptide repeat protein [Candidatus Kapabacteria bacterium]|nr:tetratricopeptide repeat protein [Candidatus Kapabacteria bacterium]
MKSKKYIVIIFLLCIASLLGCKRWDNFTTYFNTYYNQQRLLKESENEFAYQKETEANMPRVIVPDSSIIAASTTSSPPPFMLEFIVTQKQRQAVQLQVDSIIIKGSKILARHPKSDYVDKTLYLMAEAYFYKNEWLPSQIKCSELIDKFPDSEFGPDALILYAKSLLIEKKFQQAEIMLSRTIDLAWAKKRYDILTQAFRLLAEMKLYNNQLEEAIKPYKQAIAQSDDNKQKARWQLDLALLLYKVQKFERANREFDNVFNYSPDYITYYEAKLYKANTLAYLGKYKESEDILKKLERDGKFEEWLAYTKVAQLNLMNLKGDSLETVKTEKYLDSAYANNPALTSYYYLKGKSYFDSNNYNLAATYFSRARGVRSPVMAKATEMSNLLTTWKTKHQQIQSNLEKYKKGEVLSDSIRLDLATNLYELGRTHEHLNNLDSVDYYYKLASEISPPSRPESARFLYAYAAFLEDRDLKKSDSLMEIIVHNYPLTEYGKESRQKLGYTEAFVIDSVKELYESGVELATHNENYYALSQFNKLLEKYPNSKYEPRALYAMGWIYENNLKNYDSAMIYYNLLVSRYPQSEYAANVKMSVEYYAAVKSGQPIPDNLKDKQMVIYMPQEHPITTPAVPAPRKKDEGIDIKDLITNPSKLLDKGKSAIKEQIEKIQSIDPSKTLDSLKNKYSNPDSLFKLNIQESPGTDTTQTKHK